VTVIPPFTDTTRFSPIPPHLFLPITYFNPKLQSWFAFQEEQQYIISTAHQDESFIS